MEKGIFFVRDDSEKGTYLFQYSGYKSSRSKEAEIVFKTRGHSKQTNNGTQTFDWLDAHILRAKKDDVYQINNFVTLDLKNGDEVCLFNGIAKVGQDSAITVSDVHPFTFAGYKI